MKWTYEEETEEEKIGEKVKKKVVKVSGELIVDDCIYPFAGRVTPEGKYVGEVTVRLNEPGFGKTLQVEGEQRSKIMKKLSPEKKEAVAAGKRIPELDAKTTVYLNSMDERTVKRAIEKGQQRLYTKNYASIMKRLKRTSVVGSMHAMAMFKSYHKEFFLANPDGKMGTTDEKRVALEAICGALDEKPVNELKVKDLRAVYITLKESKAPWKFSVARKFFDHCRERGAYTGANPFDNYYDYYAADGSTKNPALERRAVKVHRIDFEQEIKIHQRISEHIDSPFALVIPLAKDVRLEVQEIWELKWESVLIDGTGADRTVRIRLFQPDFVGGTHNYTRPPLPAGKTFILERYDYLRKKYSEKALKKMYVVPDANDPKKQANKSAITVYIRSELLHCGITYATLAKYSDGDPKKPGGAGITLLHEHYDHVLEEQCGVEHPSGVESFLSGEVLKSVTDDRYVSYIGADGTNGLEGIVRRDGRFAPEKEESEPIINRDLDNGKTEMVIQAAGANQLTGCTGKIIVPPGSRVFVSAPYGLYGNVKVRRPGHRAKEIKKIEI